METELSECDHLILLYIHLMGKTTLREIYKALSDKCQKLNRRDSFYRRIQRKLISHKLVEKHGQGKNAYYTLTKKGKETVEEKTPTKQQALMIIENKLKKKGKKYKKNTVKAFVTFDITIENEEKHNIKIVEGYTLPKNTEHLEKLLKEAAANPQANKEITALIRHLEQIVKEKTHIANTIIEAQRNPSEKYTLIIIGTNPENIPQTIKNQINQIAKHTQTLLKKAIERIQTLQKQKPKNLQIQFIQTTQEIDKITI